MSEEELVATLQRLHADAVALKQDLERLMEVTPRPGGVYTALGRARYAVQALGNTLSRFGYAPSSPPPAGYSDEERAYLRAVAGGLPLPPRPASMDPYSLAEDRVLITGHHDPLEDEG